MVEQLLLLFLIFIYIILVMHLINIEFFNYLLLIIYTVTVFYLILINRFIDKRFITNETITTILNQNFIFSILSILMTIHIIFIKYKNSHYQFNNKLLKKDINILQEKTFDLKKQLYKNVLSVHIKKYYIQKLMNEEYVCPICLDTMEENNNVFLTLCGHLFHYDCLNEAMQFRKRCPSCRRAIYISNFQIENIEESDSSGSEGEPNEEPIENGEEIIIN